MFIQEHAFDLPGLQKKELEFRSLLDSPQGYEKTHEELHDFFIGKTPQEDRQYWYSYWRWYTELSWRLMTSLDLSTVITECFERQLPAAFLLDRDLWHDFMEYCSMRTHDEQELQSFYAVARRAVFTSPAIIGYVQKTPVTMAEIATEIETVDRQGNDSLKLADLYTKLQHLLFPGDEFQHAFIFVSPEDAVRRLVDLVHFFLGVSPENIFYVVDSFAVPEKYLAMMESLGLAEQVDKAGSVVPSEQVPQAPASAFAKASADKPKPVSTPTPFPKIKQTIEQRFAKNADAQFENIEGVFALLDQLAIEYQDDRVRDLYYFDETQGGFVWNTTLL